MGKETGNPVGKQVRKSRPPRLRDKEFTFYGWNACMRLFANRPQDILRVLFAKERSSGLAKVKDYCRSRKLPYRLLTTEDLNKVAASVHHEGVVIVARPLEINSSYSLLKQGFPRDGILFALDQIENTHNVGAILRTGAFFGSAGFIISPAANQAPVTSSAARMAEGGLELAPLYECSDLSSLLRDAKAQKVFVLGADPNASLSLYDAEVTSPCVVVLGNERTGLSQRVKKRCDLLVRIPGAGSMQSLNVSVGAGVILSELARRKLKTSTRAKKARGH